MDDEQIALLMQQMSAAMKPLLVRQMAAQIAGGMLAGLPLHRDFHRITEDAVMLAEMICECTQPVAPPVASTAAPKRRRGR